MVGQLGSVLDRRAALLGMNTVGEMWRWLGV
jgi:hypothetical protein